MGQANVLDTYRLHPWEGLASVADTGLIMSTYGADTFESTTTASVTIDCAADKCYAATETD